MFEDRWFEFLSYFHNVRCAEGQDRLIAAWEVAQKKRIEPLAKWLQSPTVVSICSCAFALQEIQGAGNPIVLPIQRLGELVGKTFQQVSNVIRAIVKAGIFEELNGGVWNRDAGEGKQYRFTKDETLYRVLLEQPRKKASQPTAESPERPAPKKHKSGGTRVIKEHKLEKAYRLQQERWRKEEQEGQNE